MESTARRLVRARGSQWIPDFQRARAGVRDLHFRRRGRGIPGTCRGEMSPRSRICLTRWSRTFPKATAPHAPPRRAAVRPPTSKARRRQWPARLAALWSGTAAFPVEASTRQGGRACREERRRVSDASRGAWGSRASWSASAVCIRYIWSLLCLLRRRRPEVVREYNLYPCSPERGREIYLDVS